MNFIFISPNFPENYCYFVEGLRKVGFNVLGIGDQPYDTLHQTLKDNITEYYKVNSMENFNEQCEAVEFFINKYGPIDYLESNNEYWLRNDAKLREKYHIEGLKPKDMDNITNKECMKKFFEKAGAKVARYTIVTNKDDALKFIKKVDYPTFIKPCVGVGAQKTYKIEDEDDLDNFFLDMDKNTKYIMEEFITGDLISFDGICNSNGDAVICDESHFLIPIDIVLHQQLDNRYYTTAFLDPKFEELGRKVVKAFGIKKRFFHIEFFKLTQDKAGLGKRGDIVGIECNMRPPGGSTPDLINFALSTSCYQVYADVMMFDENREFTGHEKYIAIAATRRDRYDYVYDEEQIHNQYRNNICAYGRNPQILSDALGDSFVYAKFKTIEDAITFTDFVLLKK